jgi:hypothetical protein
MSESELRGRVLSTMRTRLQEMVYTLQGMAYELDNGTGDSHLALTMMEKLDDVEVGLSDARYELDLAITLNGQIKP